MNEKFYSVEDLAKEVNNRSEQWLVSNSDKRSSDKLSVRRIRDYASKKFIDKPEKVGREARYTEKHVMQLLALRSLQSEGIPERYITQQIDLKDEGATKSYVVSKTASQTATPTASDALNAVAFSAHSTIDDSSGFMSHQDNHGAAVFANTTASLRSVEPVNPAMAAIHSIRMQGAAPSFAKRSLTSSLTSLNKSTPHSTVLNSLAEKIGTLSGALFISAQPAKVRQWNLAAGRVHLTAEEGSFSDDEKEQLEQQIARIIKEQM